RGARRLVAAGAAGSGGAGDRGGRHRRAGAAGGAVRTRTQGRQTVTASQRTHLEHHYRVRAEWTGNRGTGTSGYRDYDRLVTLSADGKPDLPVSSDPKFRGDPHRWNPEDLLVAALSECHLLSYLHA